VCGKAFSWRSFFESAFPKSVGYCSKTVSYVSLALSTKRIKSHNHTAIGKEYHNPYPGQPPLPLSLRLFLFLWPFSFQSFSQAEVSLGNENQQSIDEEYGVETTMKIGKFMFTV
jgi:hypothetical protein